MKHIPIIIGAYFLFACTSTLKHEIQLKLDLADPCITAFPSCTPTGYHCEEPDGTLSPGCEVNCFAASSRECRPEGPVCLQLGEEVPVICMAKD